MSGALHTRQVAAVSSLPRGKQADDKEADPRTVGGWISENQKLGRWISICRLFGGLSNGLCIKLNLKRI